MKTLKQFAKAYGLDFKHDKENLDYYIKGSYQGYYIDMMIGKYTDKGGGYIGHVEVRKEADKADNKKGLHKHIDTTTQASVILQAINLLTEIMKQDKEAIQDEPQKPYTLEKVVQADKLLETGGLSFNDRETVILDKAKAIQVGKDFQQFYYRIKNSFGKDHDRQVRESANYFIIGYLQCLLDNNLITYDDKIALGKLYVIDGGLN